MVRTVVRSLAAVLTVAGVLLAARVAFVAYGPGTDAATVDQQTRFLSTAIDGGAGPKMQRLFPEGDYFLTALTGSALAATGGPGAADRIRADLDHLDQPATVAVFGSGMAPEHGAFQAGWALALAVELAARTGQTDDQDDVERRARALERAVRESPTVFLASYPGQYWPCDSVVAVTALARAADLLGQPAWLDTVRRWRTAAGAAVDPATGLLPHRVDVGGRALEGPRGSSQSVIQAFWPDLSRLLDGRVDDTTWTAFTRSFVVSRAGLVGVTEYPGGRSGGGDVDSGPLVLGVSASASVVTLAAARAVGDTALAEALDREAELLGCPLSLPGGLPVPGGRRYALGLIPVGDAFLAWSRSRPAAAPLTDSRSPAPWWPALILAAVTPALVGGALLAGVPRRPGKRGRSGKRGSGKRVRSGKRGRP